MEVGQKVRICRFRDRVSDVVSKRLGQHGTVNAFRMTDGSGVGVLVQFEDKSAIWFFADEIEPV